MSRNIFYATFLFFLILIFFGIIYYHQLLFMQPYGVHSWGQADRLSLAICFYDSGMNFFKPCTFNQYSVNGITGVEFPLQSYLAAISGKIFGREYISISFRLINVFIGFTGLTFLFLQCYKVTRDFIFSITPPLFLFCSPVFIYYTCNYLPDAAACSISLIAFYYVFDYFRNQRTGDFVKAIIFFTVAALIKTSVGLYLFGFVSLVFLQRLSQKNNFSFKSNASFVFTVLLSFSAIIFYYFYNQHLNSKYHSEIFLAQIKPFESLEELSVYFNERVKHLWLPEYLTFPQYLMLVVIVSASIPLLCKSKEGKLHLYLMLFFLAGAITVGILMGNPLLVHDYYIVSIFLPLFVFALTCSVISIHKFCISTDGIRSLRIAFLSASVIIFFFADFQFHKRFKDSYLGMTKENFWFVNGARVLEELNIAKDEKIVVYDEMAPNTPLYYFDRKGYQISPHFHQSVPKIIKMMQDRHLRILVCEIEKAKDLLANEPLIRCNFDVLQMQNSIAVFRLK